MGYDFSSRNHTPDEAYPTLAPTPFSGQLNTYKSLRRIAIAIAILGLSLALGGCIFSPKSGKGKDPPPIVYPDPDYPDHALERLRLAYQQRDSVEYRKLIAFDYLGTSQDLTDGTSVTLFNADEVDHIQALARATTITSIDFSLGTPSSITRQSSDILAHPEWAVIQISGIQFRLEINDTSKGTLLVSNAPNTYFFRFKPTTPAPFRSDTSWTLVQWQESKPS